jgi:hypothetical protein
VIIQVEAQIAKLCSTHEALATSIDILVARDAVKTFTKLFQISIAIKSLSLFSLIFFRVLLQNFSCLTSESILCFGRLINAISVQEKKADIANKKANNNMEYGSIF